MGDKLTFEFVEYVGDPEIHDATIESVVQRGDELKVALKAASGRRFHVRFTEVQRVASHRSEGMMLYALCELQCSSPWRRFWFSPWEDEYDGKLEVIARGLEIVKGAIPRAR